MSERPFPLGRIVLGLVLIAIGIGALLQAFDVTDVRWQAVLSIALIGLGVLLAVAPGRHGGVLVLGIVLTAILAVTAVVEITFEGGVGQRSYRPALAADLRDEYRLAIGDMKLDLSEVDLTGSLELEASVGIGQLVVVAPQDVAVRVVAHASAGEVVLFGEEHGGWSVDETLTDPEYAGASLRLTLDVSVGLGRVEVRR